MDPPQTKKQGHKSAKEKKEGANRLGSSKGVRASEALRQAKQSAGKNKK
jgi:hypothetical protein